MPIALGFGIKTHSDVETMRHYADGVIVGTSIVAYTQNNSVDSVISEIGKIFG
ncbi:tryptophan synthase subunit alpha [Capnocytophaga leadbetteri]|uniref:tryptophan synthase subunit alpha n=1 Tax=Capnocytophaga leadbetteri TaxID=327575 RepID=UPI003C6ED852